MSKSEAGRWGAWTIVGIIASLVIPIMLATMYLFGWGLWAQRTADFRGETEARERIVADGDYRIQVYNEFFDRCSSIQAAEDRIKALQAELATNPPPNRVTIINASLAGVRAQRASSIRQYNADVEKDFTAGQFRDLDLPAEIDPDQEETECAATE